MSIQDKLLAVHDGKRINGRDLFYMQEAGLAVSRKGVVKLTESGKAKIKPELDARAEAAAKAKAAVAARAKAKK